MTSRLAAPPRRRKATMGRNGGTLRVAIYTRKSVAAGRDEALTSLDAQRAAVERYVEAHAGEGWVVLPDRYDDNGFSGAKAERPALDRLLADVEAGRIHLIAVYRLDRLSRNTAHLFQTLDGLQQREVAFVSVTEHFDTSTVHGRAMLGMLAIVAQMERETIAERTADKVYEARRRGMWTGGRPVLGYTSREGQLVVVEDEAEQVREIFQLYRELRSANRVLDALDERGWRQKRWTSLRDQEHGGGPWNKTALLTLLTNPLYAGRIRCGEEVVAAQHPAIVDAETWDAVRQQLAQNRREPNRQKNRHGALLQGLLRCGVCGAAMGYVTTRRGNREYGYYACQTLQKRRAAACPGSRVRARDLEAKVVAEVARIGRDREWVTQVTAAARKEIVHCRKQLVAEIRRFEGEGKRIGNERARLLDELPSANGAAPAIRERLAELEPAYQDALGRAQRAREELQQLRQETMSRKKVMEALADWDRVWVELFPHERHRLLELVLEGVAYHGGRDEVEVHLRAEGLA